MKMVASENTNAAAKSFQIQRLEIESIEPPDFAVLNLLVHNQLCQAVGSTDGIVHIALWRRALCQWKDFPPKKWQSLEKYEAEKSRSTKAELQAST